MGPFRINQLRYRASDGRVMVATNGRGVWQTDVWAVPFTPSTIAITGVSNTTLCAGSTLAVSYSTTGAVAAPGTTVEVWLSDANGNFANQKKVGSGTTSPISVTLPGINKGAFPYGTNYRFRLVTQDVTSEQSDPVAIGDLLNAFATDRRGDYLSYSTSVAICPGGRVTLTAYQRGSNNVPTLADGYAWTLDGTPVSGATSQTLLAQQAGNYQATVKQAGCSVQTSQYVLSYSNSIYSYVWSVSNRLPQCTGTAQTLRSDYIGEGAVYQWRRNKTDIPGATTDTLAVTQSGAYSFRMNDRGCISATSDQPVLFGPSLYARATRQTGSDSVICPGPANSIILFADGISSDAISTGLYTIQWYRNNIAIEATNKHYYDAFQPGSYSFTLKQSTCTARSNALIVYEGTAITPPTIAISSGNSVGQTACPGETRLLYASGGTGNYQWLRNGTDIAGATSYQYTAQVSGSYTCRASRGTCQATSAPLSLTFANDTKPLISANNNTAGISCSFNFLSYATSGQLPGNQYQWFQDETVVSNATGTSLYVSQSGSYRLRVTNGACTGLSNPIAVQLGQAAKPVITVGASSQSCAGNTVQLTATKYQGLLQWQRNGTAIVGATTYQLYAAESGQYSVVNQDASCFTESDRVTVTVGQPTSATLSGTTSLNYGQTAALPVTFTGPAPWTVALTNGLSASAIFQNPYSFSVAPSTTTTYQLASVYNACSSGTVHGLAVVTVGNGGAGADVSLGMVVSNRTPRVEEPVEFTVQVNNAGPLEATGVRVSSRLPPNMTFVDSPSSDVVFAGDSVRITVGSIAIDNTQTFRFRAKATQPGVFIAAAQVVAATTPDPDSQPDSGTEDGQDDAAFTDIRTPDAGAAVFISPNPRQKSLPPVQDNQPPTEPNKADLSLNMVASTLTPRPGEVFSLSLTVSNRGGAGVAAIQLEMLLPDGWELASTANVSSVNGQTVRTPVSGNSVPPAGQYTQVFLVRANQSGTVKAQILAATPGDSDSILGNGYDNGEDDEARVSIRVLN